MVSVRFRWLLPLLLLVSLLKTLNLYASENTHLVIAGDSNHPPYSYVEDGINKGIYVDIITSALGQVESYSYTIKLFPWKRALSVAQSGRGHALFPPHYFPEKRPYLSHYSKPILKEYVSVYCHQDALSHKGIHLAQNNSEQQTTKWPEPLFGANFAISRGVKMGGADFWQAVDDGKISIIETNGVKDAIRMMLAKRVDCHINDQVTVEWHLNHFSNKYAADSHASSLSTSTPHLQPNPGLIKHYLTVSTSAGYLAISDKWDSTKAEQFLDHFNKVLDHLYQSGDVERIIKRYMDHSGQ